MKTLQQKIVHLSIIGIFVSLYFLVATISMINSVAFFDLAHSGVMSWSLAIGFEMGAAASLAAILILDKTNKTMVWGLFVLLTAFQMMANSYHAFVNLDDYMGWIELFGLQEEEPIFQKRLLSIVSGAVLPIVALGFIKSLTDYIRPETDEIEPELLTEISEEPLTQVNEVEDLSFDISEDEIIDDLNTGRDEFDEDHLNDMALNAMVEDMDLEDILTEDEMEVYNRNQEESATNEDPPEPFATDVELAKMEDESTSGSDEVEVRIDGDTTYVTTKKPQTIPTKNTAI